jgi:hypothetical protein
MGFFLNMHDIVRGAITSVNDDVPAMWYSSTGYTNNQGILTPTFTTLAITVQVQAKDHSGRVHDRALNYSTDFTTVYAYGNLADMSRPDGQGGDILNIGGEWWYISRVNEWWPTWCSVEVSRQVNATTLAQLQALIANGTVPAP